MPNPQNYHCISRDPVAERVRIDRDQFEQIANATATIGHVFEAIAQIEERTGKLLRGLRIEFGDVLVDPADVAKSRTGPVYSHGLSEKGTNSPLASFSSHGFT